jgi:hypothetical protein
MPLSVFTRHSTGCEFQEIVPAAAFGLRANYCAGELTSLTSYTPLFD